MILCDPVLVHICRNPAGSADPPPPLPKAEAEAEASKLTRTPPGRVGEEGDGAGDGHGARDLSKTLICHQQL